MYLLKSYIGQQGFVVGKLGGHLRSNFLRRSKLAIVCRDLEIFEVINYVHI